MHTLGYFDSASRDLDGNLLVTFKVMDEAEEAIEKIKDKQLVLDIKRFHEKRSLNANAYFWVLCTELGKKLGVDKDTVYAWQLSRWGVFEDVQIVKDALELFKRNFRVVQIIDENNNLYTLRCYFGSSTYNRKEMTELINGTVQDCKEQNIETWTPQEINRLLELWEG